MVFISPHTSDQAEHIGTCSLAFQDASGLTAREDSDTHTLANGPLRLSSGLGPLSTFYGGPRFPLRSSLVVSKHKHSTALSVGATAMNKTVTAPEKGAIPWEKTDL